MIFYQPFADRNRKNLKIHYWEKLGKSGYWQVLQKFSTLPGVIALLLLEVQVLPLLFPNSNLSENVKLTTCVCFCFV